MAGKAFIDREVFQRTLQQVRTAAGGAYQDVETIYGDMARLVVGWLAKTEPNELNRIYNELGWGGSANGRALHEAARQWMQTHRPDQLKGLSGE